MELNTTWWKHYMHLMLWKKTVNVRSRKVPRNAQNRISNRIEKLLKISKFNMLTENRLFMLHLANVLFQYRYEIVKSRHAAKSKQIRERNFYFGRKFWILTKNWTLDEKFDFWRKIRILTKLWIFDKNIDLWQIIKSWQCFLEDFDFFFKILNLKWFFLPKLFC